MSAWQPMDTVPRPASEDAPDHSILLAVQWPSGTRETVSGWWWFEQPDGEPAGWMSAEQGWIDPAWVIAWQEFPAPPPSEVNTQVHSEERP